MSATVHTPTWPADPEHREAIDTLLLMAAAEDRGILENARDHRKGDVEYTIRTMGPPEWGAELENGGRRRESHSRE